MKRRAEELLFCKLCNFSMTFSSHLQKHNNTEKHLRNCRIAVSDEGLSYQGQIYQDTDVDDRKVCSLLLTTGNDTLVFTNVKKTQATSNCKHRITCSLNLVIVVTFVYSICTGPVNCFNIYRSNKNMSVLHIYLAIVKLKLSK